MRLRSVPFLCQPHRSPRWRPCFLVCVRSLPGWTGGCRPGGGFRDHLPIEVRADFERLMISGSRALEFLASQGCTTLGNLVLARRDSLLADVRGTVPDEEVARPRYSSLHETASIFPHPLLDSALLKMRAAASDALVAEDSPSAQDSSETCGVWSVCWILDCSLWPGRHLWCFPGSEAVVFFFSLGSGWPEEEEGQRKGSLFLFLPWLRPLERQR